MFCALPPARYVPCSLLHTFSHRSDPPPGLCSIDGFYTGQLFGQPGPFYILESIPYQTGTFDVGFQQIQGAETRCRSLSSSGACPCLHGTVLKNTPQAFGPLLIRMLSSRDTGTPVIHICLLHAYESGQTGGQSFCRSSRSLSLITGSGSSSNAYLTALSAFTLSPASMNVPARLYQLAVSPGSCLSFLI